MNFNPYASYSANLQVNGYNPRFFAWVEDWKIIGDDNGTPREVGVTFEEYNRLKAEHSEYQQKLIEVGVIKLPLTQEQIMDKLMAELQEEKLARQRLMEFIDELTGPKKQEVVTNGSKDDISGRDERNVAHDIDAASGV